MAHPVAVTFTSEIKDLGSIEFPRFTGLRVMMMPFHLHDPTGSIPAEMSGWRRALLRLRELSSIKHGIGYLTVDEAVVRAGETHRRPGIHVDGVGADGGVGAWGGGGKYAANGMLTAASAFGCVGWNKSFFGGPAANGDCAHLESQCPDEDAVSFLAGRVYWCNPLAVHKSVPMVFDTKRQFVRVSMPSHGPWYEGYTRNPLGIEPEGPIHPARTEFMAYRS